ncbi:MAG: S8 family serine peptidase [Chloroflexi bacterium]|nr:S8 family serine peptidase [Chloroflexota bacterium]MDA1218516.1 S8 family serine peptidase [Chloroflexota bacterium]
MKRTISLLFIAVAALILGTAGISIAQGTPPTNSPAKALSKVPTIVMNTVDQLEKGEPLASPWLVQSSLDGRLRLEFHSANAVGDSEKEDLEKLGASIEKSSGDILWTQGAPPGLGVIAAWVPYQQVDAAARLPWVVAITPVEENTPDAGSSLSEGVDLHNAAILHGLGIDGAGVTVGVISDGVTNIVAAQNSGDLPQAVNVLNAGIGDEGTAMLEIVHDMAPGADLIFYATGGGIVNHLEARNALMLAGADVIVEDIPFDLEPVFQQGTVAQNGDALAAAGISVHSSAGDTGNTHAARVLALPVPLAEADVTGFTNCDANFLNANSRVVDIDPGPGTSFDVTLDGNAFFTLQWSEPRAIFPTAGAGGFTDLDLYLMNEAGNECLSASNTGQQFGQGDTIETISAPFGAGTRVKIVVVFHQNLGDPPIPTIDLRWRGATAIDPPTRAGSINPNANYTGLATSSGAANAGPGGSTNPSLAGLEGFSSGGPITLGLTTVCSNGYPCSFLNQGTEPVLGPGLNNFDSPNWTAADGVSVSGAGGFGSGTCPAANLGDCRFFGTSAAAPHAAGAAALLLDADPSLTPAAINSTLGNTAFDIGAAGFDLESGFGILQVDAAVKSLNAISIDSGPSGNPNPVDSSFPANLSVSASDIIGLPLSYSWSANCLSLADNGSFDDAEIANPVWTAPANGAVSQQDCQIDVTVTDGLGNSNTGILVLSVNGTPVNLKADISFDSFRDKTNGAAEIAISVNRVFDIATNIDVPAQLVGFHSQLSYNGSCVKVLGFRTVDIPITDSNIDNTGGVASFDGLSLDGVPVPADLGHVRTRLMGSNQLPCSLGMQITSLTDVDDNPILTPNTLTHEFLRGDALADGVISITDALFIAQYLVGLRSECTTLVANTCLHSVNAASVKQDGAFDQKTIADALFIAQYLVGLRDESYNLIQ